MIGRFVLIIGAMKSGTTTLYDYLGQHPQIARGLDKEPGFFAFEENWSLGFDWYESQFRYNPLEHCYALDATTDYTKYPFCKEVPERLRASAPRQFKLIYIMRHPLRRIESHARYVAKTKHEIGRCLSPRTKHTLDAGVSPVSMAISRYSYQIDKFSEFYDNGDLLLLTLEQLARNPAVVLERICRFLDITSFTVDEESLRSNVATSDTPYLIRQHLFPFWEKLNSVALLRSAVKNVVPQSLRSTIYSTAEMWSSPTGRFALTPEQTEALTSTLIPDLKRLRDRYGIDVEKEWGIGL